VLSPEQRAAAVKWMSAESDKLRSSIEYNTSQYKLKGDSFYARYVPQMEAEKLHYDSAITALTNEAALAELVRGLREALKDSMHWLAPLAHGSEKDIHYQRVKKLLATPFPEAARQAAERESLIDRIYSMCTKQLADDSKATDSVTLIEICTEIEALRATKEDGNG